jgi:transcriptional regulator with XRE-family HTH domain
MEDFGEPKTWNQRARERMAELGVTQAALAAAIGAQVGRVGHYLSGRNEPPLAHLMLICRHLQVSADWLLFGGPNAPLPIPNGSDDLASQIKRLDSAARRDIEGFIRIRLGSK